MKRLFYTFLACALVIVNLCVTVDAQDICDDDILCLAEMEHELIDISTLDVLKESMIGRSTKSINGTVAAYSHSISTEKIFLTERGIITINCSYSPSSASVDFGVIAPDGYFYFLNVEGGSINQSIKVSQGGRYAVAIRNNSSNTINVAGFADY